MELPDTFKMDKTVFSTATLHDPSNEPAFWRTQSHQTRLEALEFLRRVMYGHDYNPVSDRIPRLLEVIKYTAR